MNRVLLLAALASALCVAVAGQTQTGDILGAHNLSPSGTSPVTGAGSGSCLYCHAPHSGLGGNTPLWSQTLSSQTYSLYTSSTVQNVPTQPTVGGATSLCLSCHDGTVAAGRLVPYGNLTMKGSMYASDVFGASLKASHPVSLVTPLKDSSHLVASLAATQTTADPLQKVKLINGTVECTSCHEPHNQYIDQMSPNFLVRDGSGGQICLSCHEPNARTVDAKINPLTQWSSSIHALSGNMVDRQAKLGGYSTVAQFACISCHVPHSANGTAGLLRAPATLATGMDAGSQSCVTCHSGGTNLQQALPNVYSEIAKGGHPYPAGTNTHDPAEAGVLVNNRHATCADCHNAHSSFAATFNPAPRIRASQAGVVGVNASDSTVLAPAVNQYENCLRCHGTSPGKQTLQGYFPMRIVAASDRLNVIPEFSLTATSSHPVMHDSNSPYGQPSLRPYMLNLDGATESSRALSSGTGRVLCTDCHNSDDNREFGGAGPNGPHGSVNLHILERRYEFTTASMPGAPVNQQWPQPSLSAGGAVPGPYALCGKCHDLTNILTNSSFLPNANTGRGGHLTHISDLGFSCSVCHTAHGMGSLSATISGDRLVNFDLNVVAALTGYPISYNRSTNTCTLTCHGYNHYPDGSVLKLN